jgi:hypothetical protein
MTGSIKEAKNVRDLVSKKLQSIGLTLNLEKTHITSLRGNNKCHFLGVDFFIRKNTDKHHKPVSLVKKKYHNTSKICAKDYPTCPHLETSS